jgi:mannose-6-phosphate isomerase-like protein (cupin superfamily)
MEVRTPGTYDVEDREMVAEGADIRIQVLTLGPGQCVPWHYHSEISDSFVCLEGRTVVETKAPSKTIVLKPGQRYTVGPKTAHTVSGKDDGRCKFMIIQGVGTYDFMPVGPRE